MSLKRWVLGKVQGPSTGSRGTVRRVAPSLHGESAQDDEHEPLLGSMKDDGGKGAIAHLGPYAPLIASIREELEQFVESQLKLHLAIAERDRYVLTSIDVDCRDQVEHAALLRRFVAEFKPEQIKRFLARDIIAGLPNASAIDLTQFAGLTVASDLRADNDDPYRELVADLDVGTSDASARAFDVTLAGRWVQFDASLPEPAHGRARGEPRRAERASTPLAGRTLTLEIEDAGGPRNVEVGAVVPGRRYVIGKDDGCDVVVDGVYASRRHCEVWFDRDAWWIADVGSTNGLRVEAKGAITRIEPSADKPGKPIEVPGGALVLLSASAQGEARLYPRMRLCSSVSQATATTSANAGAPLVTPLAPSRPREPQLRIAARMASGMREMDIGERSLPLGVGRSREQALVVDRAHADVSGRHLEIVAADADGAWVVVHGDNGVMVEGAPHGPGTRFLWKSGETMQVGRANTLTPACTLTFSRNA
jgi:hypothetical protein